MLAGYPFIGMSESRLETALRVVYRLLRVVLETAFRVVSRPNLEWFRDCVKNG